MIGCAPCAAAASLAHLRPLGLLIGQATRYMPAADRPFHRWNAFGTYTAHGLTGYWYLTFPDYKEMMLLQSALQPK